MYINIHIHRYTFTYVYIYTYTFDTTVLDKPALRYCYPTKMVQFHLENDKRSPQYTLGTLEADCVGGCPTGQIVLWIFDAVDCRQMVSSYDFHMIIIILQY